MAETGLDDFYRGDIARHRATSLEGAGCPLRLADLESLYAAEVSPLSLQLGNCRVFNHFPPKQAAIFPRYAFYNRDIQEAVTAPRWLLGKTWGDDSTNLTLESRFEPELIESIIEAGHEVDVVGPFDNLMGHAGAVIYHQSGLIEGATDPRADGESPSWESAVLPLLPMRARLLSECRVFLYTTPA